MKIPNTISFSSFFVFLLLCSRIAVNFSVAGYTTQEICSIVISAALQTMKTVSMYLLQYRRDLLSRTCLTILNLWTARKFWILCTREVHRFKEFIALRIILL
jgi:hypothetical protein